MTKVFNIAQIFAEVFQPDLQRIDSLSKQIEPNPIKRKLLLAKVWAKSLKSYRERTLFFTGDFPMHPIQILIDLLHYINNRNHPKYTNRINLPDLELLY